MAGPHRSPDLQIPESLWSRLFGIAYRMLGTVADAEDVLPRAYVRWHESDREIVRCPEAWLVAGTTRLAIDRLRQVSSERETYPGPWLPKADSTPTDRRAEPSSDLSMAFLVLLERLGPEERAAFLLRDVSNWSPTTSPGPQTAEERYRPPGGSFGVPTVWSGSYWSWSGRPADESGTAWHG